MKQFKLVDIVLGWVVFAIAAFVYCSTIEPTASFWDCPEFITTGYKLEIGHPPGAPFFALTANLFSHFASDVSQVARMVNTMSALLSAVCIMFLFWTISHLVRRLIVKDDTLPSLSEAIAIEGSALVGALVYTFSDTFWFSAVEGEVYAYSSAFTAIVFWLILKWENCADAPHSDRWLVLIFYMTGLSIGVHLLNLLCIPAIVLVYYYKKMPNANAKGSLFALLLSVIIVAAVLYGVVPGIITVGGWFELFFVNTLGMPFNTGVIVYIILLVASFVWALWETYQSNHTKRENMAFLTAFGLLGVPFVGYGWSAFFTGIVILAILFFVLNMKRGKQQVSVIPTRLKNTALLCMLMLMIGFSSYALIVIRSTANPPMDQNSPEDIFTLGNYLSRQQYGQYPLLYGQAFTSEPAIAEDGMHYEFKEGAPVYEPKEKESKDEKDSYYLVRHQTTQVFEQNMFFPRMWDDGHAEMYESWMGGIKGHDVDGVKIPTQMENLKFFLSYQCNFMYWRYFMWNFAGRQNDLQGNGEREHGNWITGFNWFDNHVLGLGDQSLMPDSLKANKGHNVFYCMPLLLGLLGLLWQAFRGKRGIQQFWVVCFLFFMTGLAIVIYLNQTPGQPRERDYAYAGSFYAYAIWCGMGVAALWEWFKKLRVSPIGAAIVVSILGLIVPIQMASQTWDDHDRSGRYTCRDYGRNYLMSLQDKGNPIIFTNGDNDTFPLWYNQEVEGVRTDARVCNLSYLSTDWYIDQMTRPAYSSPALPITWPRIDYVSGTNEYVRVQPDFKQQVLDFYRQNPEEARSTFGDDPFEIHNIMKYWVRSKDENNHVIPTDTIFVNIDKEAVRHSGMLLLSDSIPSRMAISLKGKNGLMKNDLMMLELIANCNWTRPLYVATTVGKENFMNLSENFIQEGLAYRITPFNTAKPTNVSYDRISFDKEKMYKNIMTRFRWGNVSMKGFYMDETILRMCYTHRRTIADLALQFIQDGDKQKALNLLRKADKELPDYNVPTSYMGGSGQMAQAYLMLGQKKDGERILNAMWKDNAQYVRFYCSLDAKGFKMSQQSCYTNLQILMSLLQMTDHFDKSWSNQHVKELSSLIQSYQLRGGSFGS